MGQNRLFFIIIIIILLFSMIAIMILCFAHFRAKQNIDISRQKRVSPARRKDHDDLSNIQASLSFSNEEIENEKFDALRQQIQQLTDQINLQGQEIKRLQRQGRLQAGANLLETDDIQGKGSKGGGVKEIRELKKVEDLRNTGDAKGFKSIEDLERVVDMGNVESREDERRALSIAPSQKSDTEYLDQYPSDVARVLTMMGGVPVIASPYSGGRTPFDGSHLISSYPRTRLDLNILAERQKINQYYLDNNIPLTDRPFLDISGDIEVTPFLRHDAGQSSKAGFDFREIFVSLTAGINSWITGYTAFSLNSGPSEDGGSTFKNSNIFLDHGFLTVGNLNRTPYFATLGQTYVSFGRYTNYFINQTLPRALGRTKGREIAIGYRQSSNDGVYTNLFAFNGDSGPGNDGTFGGTVAYVFNNDVFSSEFGVAAISSISDSTGLQNLAGFGTNAATERLSHRVSALNAYGRVNIGHYGFVAEYVGATKAFDTNDLSFNGHGARPQAWDTQAAYFFEVYEKPTSIALGYSGTSESSALGLPQNRLALGVNTTIWRNTIQQIEIRRDINYCVDTQAGGPIRGGKGFSSKASVKSANVVTFMMAVYY